MSCLDHATLELVWERGILLGPDGLPQPLLPGEAPDIALAHEAVDAWADATELRTHLPHVDGWTPWWYLRFQLVHELLFRMLPQFRTLRPLLDQEALRTVRLRQVPFPCWKTLLNTYRPALHIEEEQLAPPHMPKVQRIASRILRAVVTEGRLARLAPPRPGRPRVLVVAQSRYWNGQRDTFFQPAICALENAGAEVLVLVQSRSGHSLGLAALRERPRHHLFGDIIYLRSPRGRSSCPEVRISDCPLWIEGVDWAPVARGWISRHLPVLVAEQARHLSVLPAVISRIRPDAVLLQDENGAEHFVSMACAKHGVPTIAVQHGCIHPDHLHYMFPGGLNPEHVPLAGLTCVFGEHYRTLLTRRSIYPPHSVLVTGDPRDSGNRPSLTGRSAEAEAFRRAVLPKGAETLVLLTSQDLVYQILGPTFLQAIARSSPKIFAVVRPHPREGDTWHWKSWLEKFGVQDRVALLVDPPLSVMLEACDLHCSASSTALGEAVYYGRPSLVVGARFLGDWMGVLEAKAALPLEAFPDLDAAAAHWRQPDAWAAFLDAAQHYRARHFEAGAASAAERIAGAVLRVIEHPA